MRGTAIKADDEGELETWLYGLDLPITSMTQMIGRTPTETGEKLIGTMVSPFAKTIPEILMKRHTYFQKPLEEANYVSPGIGKVLKKAKLDKAYGLTEFKSRSGKTYYRTSNVALHHLLMSFAGRVISTSGKMSDPELTLLAKLMYFLAGTKAAAISPEAQKYYKTKEQKEKMGKLLQDKGVMGEFKKFFELKK